MKNIAKLRKYYEKKLPETELFGYYGKLVIEVKEGQADAVIIAFHPWGPAALVEDMRGAMLPYVYAIEEELGINRKLRIVLPTPEGQPDHWSSPDNFGLALQVINDEVEMNEATRVFCVGYSDGATMLIKLFSKLPPGLNVAVLRPNPYGSEVIDIPTMRNLNVLLVQSIKDENSWNASVKSTFLQHEKDNNIVIKTINESHQSDSSKELCFLREFFSDAMRKKARPAASVAPRKKDTTKHPTASVAPKARSTKKHPASSASPRKKSAKKRPSAFDSLGKTSARKRPATSRKKYKQGNK